MNVGVVFGLLLGIIYISDTTRQLFFIWNLLDIIILEMVLICVILIFGLNTAEKNFLFSYLKKRVKKWNQLLIDLKNKLNPIVELIKDKNDVFYFDTRFIWTWAICWFITEPSNFLKITILMWP